MDVDYFDFGDTVQATLPNVNGAKRGFVDAISLLDTGTSYSFIGTTSFFMSNRLMTTRVILTEKTNQLLQTKMSIMTQDFGVQDLY